MKHAISYWLRKNPWMFSLTMIISLIKRFQNPVPLKISESMWRKFTSWPHKVTDVNEKRLLLIFSDVTVLIRFHRKKGGHFQPFCTFPWRFGTRQSLTTKPYKASLVSSFLFFYTPVFKDLSFNAKHGLQNKTKRSSFIPVKWWNALTCRRRKTFIKELCKEKNAKVWYF